MREPGVVEFVMAEEPEARVVLGRARRGVSWAVLVLSDGVDLVTLGEKSPIWPELWVWSP